MENKLTAIFVSVFVHIICGQSEGLDTSNITKYGVIQQRTDEFIRYCPYTGTCTIDAKNTFSVRDGIVYGACCEPCGCEDYCGFNCCPDKSIEFAGEKDFYNAKELVRCVNAQYKPSYDESVSFSFNMVSSCPFNYNDTGIARQCRREYREFEFQSPLRHFLPVYDQKTDSVYKNIFCAICHEADINRLDFALLSFSCTNRQKNITYIRDFASSFSEAADSCNFKFFPKSLRSPWMDRDRVCERNFISRCNVTGKWETYDPALEETCLSYGSVYQSEANLFYKNVHCFLCNGFDEQDITSMCPKPQNMISSIDFTNVFSKNEADPPTLRIFKDGGKEDHCLEEEVFSSLQKNAWALHCPFGMVLADKMCFPPSMEISQTVAMHTSLILEPYYNQGSHTATSVYEILSQISNEAEKFYSMLITNNILLPYIVTGFVRFETIPDFDKTMLVKFDIGTIKQIVVQAKVTMNGIKDAILPILDFALLLNNITHIGNFKLKFFRPNSYLLQEDELVSTCTSDNEHPKFYLCNDKSYLNKTLIGFKITEYDTDLHDEHNMHAVRIGVEREPFCPRVALKKLAFANRKAACKESDMLSQILTDVFMSKLLAENETHLFFCYEDYFRHLTKLKLHAKLDKAPNTKELAYLYLSMICLCASITSLVVTVAIYSAFSVLRTLPGLNNLALSVSLLVYHSMALVNTITFVEIGWLCCAIGVVTHFSLISSFSWMFICTFQMLKVFIKIRNKTVPVNFSRTFFIYAIFAIVVAAMSVFITILVAEVRSGGQDIGYGGKGCYIKDPVMIMFAVALPVALVVILNFCMFCVVIFQINRMPSLAASKSKERRNTFIFIKLSTLTGLSWIFGFVYLFTKLYTFGYTFLILNGGQGVFIMFSFIFNRRVWKLIRGQGSEASKAHSGTSSSRLALSTRS